MRIELLAKPTISAGRGYTSTSCLGMSIHGDEKSFVWLHKNASKDQLLFMVERMCMIFVIICIRGINKASERHSLCPVSKVKSDVGFPWLNKRRQHSFLSMLIALMESSPNQQGILTGSLYTMSYGIIIIIH